MSKQKIGITYIAVCVKVSCLLKLTLSTNSGSHTSQFDRDRDRDIRKKVTENRQTEKAITDTTLIVDGLSG